MQATKDLFFYDSSVHIVMERDIGQSLNRFNVVKFGWKKEEYMRRLSFGLFIIILLVMAAGSKAQNSVTVTITAPPYNQIYAADLDIQHVKSSGVLFTVMLSPTVDIKVKLYLIIAVTLPGENSAEIAWARSTPLTLYRGQDRIITSVDLSGENPPVKLEDYQIIDAEFDKIKSVGLATGKAPAGEYVFTVSCLDMNDQTIPNSTTSAAITVTNPSRVDLVLPMNGENITTLFPHFQWSANADTVRLSIYQKLPNQQSPQDVVSGVPFLQQSVSGSSFNYPSSGPGVRPLENGMTYYWFLDIPPSSTRGSGLRSDIWSFTEGRAGASGGSSVDNDAATKALVGFLTGTQFQSLLSQITTLTGDASYDGSPLSMQDVIDLLQNMDKSKIISVTIQ